MSGSRKAADAKKEQPKEQEPNPALVREPEPVDNDPHRYKVVGPHVVHDTAPGETFVANLSPDQEKFLTDTGHITKVGGPLAGDKE